MISRIRTVTPVEDRAAGVCMPKWFAPSIATASSAHKWLRCMMSTQQPNSADAYFHLRAPCKISYANIRLLCDESDSLPHCLQYFDAVVPPAACYAETHGKILQMTSTNSMLFSAVCSDQWSAQVMWIGHELGMKFCISGTGEQSNPCAWSTRCSKTHWKFASYVAQLSSDPWV